jgi:hypothetical protein
MKLKKDGDSVVATVNKAKEIKLCYSRQFNCIRYVVRGGVVKTLSVRKNYPLREFISEFEKLKTIYSEN